LRILWLADGPTVYSGYGIETALFVPRLQDLGHEMILFTPHNYMGAPFAINGVRVYGSSGRDAWGCDILAQLYRYTKSDLLITLADPFNLRNAAESIAPFNVAHWTPVDTDRMSAADLELFRRDGAVPVAMSRHGEHLIGREGLEPLYVPHGVDTKVFTPDGENARQQFGIREDAFVIGVNAVNTNSPRKGLAEQVQAFAAFHRVHPDSWLMLHTAAKVAGGYDIASLLSYLEIRDAVILPPQFAYDLKLLDGAAMATWYRTLDLYSGTAYGEGFGVPLLEAQACGVPVVVTKHSAMSELAVNGWNVQGDPWWAGGHDAMWVRPFLGHITAAYQQAYEAREHGQLAELRARAREFALPYDADTVADQYWKPVLDTLQARAQR
jgi:glycosyltransferase involved in cell wall biosynthesis